MKMVSRNAAKLAPYCVLLLILTLSNISQCKEDAIEEQIRHKRAVGAILGAVVGLGQLVFDIVKFADGKSNSNMAAEEKLKFRQVLDKLDIIIEDLQSLDALETGQKWNEGAALYGRDVQRLKFLLHRLQTLVTAADGTYVSCKKAIQWAEAVLSLDADGIPQVMHNFHDMMVGNSNLFGKTPLFSIFRETLDYQSEDYMTKLFGFLNFTYSIQIAGYASWIIALNIEDGTDEIPVVQELGKGRMAQQEELLTELLIEDCGSKCSQSTAAPESAACEIGQPNKYTPIICVALYFVFYMWH